MVFQKGHEKLGGRAPGVPNEKTEQWEAFAYWMMTDGIDRFKDEMELLEGKDFVNTVLALMEYFKPKLARNDGSINHTGEVKQSLTVKIIDGNGNRVERGVPGLPPASEV